jgi:hypothetical protein
MTNSTLLNSTEHIMNPFSPHIGVDVVVPNVNRSDTWLAIQFIFLMKSLFRD